MRAKVSTIWYVDTPDPATALAAGDEPDPGAASALAHSLHPDCDVVPIPAGTLVTDAGPAIDRVYIGCYPQLTVVCGSQFALPRPSRLAEDLVRPLASEHTFLVSADPRLGWGGFAQWERGILRRSFSATTVNILEDEGLPVAWERPFWAGEHPLGVEAGPQRLPFDPLHFADTANQQWLGFSYRDGATPVAPATIAVCGFALYPLGQAPLTPHDASTISDGAGWSFRKWLRGRRKAVNPAV